MPSPDEHLLTTSQVADLLDVHPSTVKRWANDGDLSSAKTDGGHRRIGLDAVLDLAREREIPTFLDPFAPDEEAVWAAVREAVDGGDSTAAHGLAMRWLEAGEIARTTELLFTLGHGVGLPLCRFLDEVARGFMRRVGDAWRDGRILVGEEHMASQALIEALLRLRGAISAEVVPRDGRIALVGAMEGDHHHLGSMCVRLALERVGWTVFYMGADVPVEDFVAIQRSRSASLVCISFSPPATPADMRRCVRILRQFYRDSSPFTLALGGGAAREPLTGLAVPPFRDVAVFESCQGLLEALDGGFGGIGGGASA